MTIIQAEKELIRRLGTIYDANEARSLARQYLAERLQSSSAQLLANAQETLTEIQKQQMAEDILVLLKGMPLQYLIGKASFLGMELEVSSSVLIPRSETEELVQNIIQEHQNRIGLHILDLCTGSACIAIALKKHCQNSIVHAVDISAKALEIAQQNAQNLSCDIIFSLVDICKETPSLAPQSLDIISSNPPYVRQREKVEMHKNVLDFEPEIALFVPNDNPLIFYQAIAKISQRLLKPQGHLYLEINQYLGQETQQLFLDMGFSRVELAKDFRGNHRFIKASI